MFLFSLLLFSRTRIERTTFQLNRCRLVSIDFRSRAFIWQSQIGVKVFAFENRKSINTTNPTEYTDTHTHRDYFGNRSEHVVDQFVYIIKSIFICCWMQSACIKNPECIAGRYAQSFVYIISSMSTNSTKHHVGRLVPNESIDMIRTLIK